MNSLYHIFIGEWETRKPKCRKDVICGVGMDVVPPLTQERYAQVVMDDYNGELSHGEFQNFAGHLLYSHFEKVRKELGRPIMIGKATQVDETPSVMPSYNFTNLPFSFVADFKMVGGWHVKKELNTEEKEDFLKWAFDTDSAVRSERMIEDELRMNISKDYRVLVRQQFDRMDFPNIRQIKLRKPYC